MVEYLSVHHKVAAGWHTFTCAQLPGFFVAGPDTVFPEAIGTVPEAICLLVRAHTKREVKAEYLGCGYADPYRQKNDDLESSQTKEEILQYVITTIQP